MSSARRASSHHVHGARSRCAWRALALSTLLLGACSKAPTATAPSPWPLRFIADDYPQALAQARARKLPLFVDVWASWCHTCMSMKQFVLRDRALAPLADRFVWLAIDSERADNGAFLAHYPSRSLPTLWVIDAQTETPLLKWIGAATADELKRVLGDAVASGKEPGAARARATALWLQADRASARNEPEEAIAQYREALALAPEAWPERGRAAEALSMRLVETKQSLATVELAERELARLPKSTSLLNVMLNAIDALEALSADQLDPARAAALVDRGVAIANDSAFPVLFDDRSSLYLSLIGALEKRDHAAAQRLARGWSDQLDNQAAKAATPQDRRVWDPHRLEAYLALGEAQRALPMLEQSERDDPSDYNAPYRLARALLTLGDHAQARAAIERALGRCDGPRKLRLYLLKADVQLAAQDRSGARQTLQAARDFAQQKQLSAQYDKLRETIERRIADLS